MNTNYPAFIFRDEDAFTVVFPDIPGCQTWAGTITEAFDNARIALGNHIAAMEDEGMKIPAPSALDRVTPDDDYAADVVATVLVPVSTNGKTVRANITIDETILLRIDEVSPNRSVFFAEAARRELDRRTARS